MQQRSIEAIAFLLTNIKKSQELFFPNSAEGFWGHSEHGSNVLQGHLVEQFPIVLKKVRISLLGCHGQMTKNSLFEDDEAAHKKELFQFVPTVYQVANFAVISFGDGINFRVHECLNG